MSKICKNCRYFATNGCSNVCTLYCCGTSDDENCRNYEAQTVFDRITQSPDVLAEKLVYHGVTSWDEDFYVSTICAGVYKTRAEAFAATVEKLTGVAEDANV